MAAREHLWNFRFILSQLLALQMLFHHLLRLTKGTFLSNLNQRLLRPAKSTQNQRENVAEILGVGSQEGKREFGWVELDCTGHFLITGKGALITDWTEKKKTTLQTHDF